MALFKVQGVLVSSFVPSYEEIEFGTCSRIWDPRRARFEACVLPYIAGIPAGISACILLGYILRLLPRGLRAPQWTRPFVEEPKPIPDDSESPLKYPFSRLTLALLAISIVGFGLQLLSVFHPTLQIHMVYPTASWLFVCLLIAISRPTTTPKASLVLYITILASQSIILIDRPSHWTTNDIPAILSSFSSLIAILIISIMPMRDPHIPSEEISPAFSPPTYALRSPEDNLTLWQFMTVSWMAPLISLGNKRQLSDDDVWSLGYEFKHRVLHDTFRELKGSVIGRLMRANGVDLCIVSALGILELVANFSSPVLLQKLLQSFGDAEAPKRAALNYAFLSLVARLVSCQSGVFTLWYGRRCYERSRGELITMLYEKTLMRKVVSMSSKAVPQVDQNGVENENSAGKHEGSSASRKFLDALLSPFNAMCGRRSKKKRKKNLASMGKIMNLMRFDAYEVAQRFWEFNNLVSQPLGLVFAIVLIWRLLGWPCLIGIITVFFAQGINALFARALLHWERERRISTDTKLHKISQLVDAIRHLRYYGWQDVWLGRIMKARQHELKLRVITSIWNIMISFTNTLASGMFPVVAFWAYTVLAGESLRVDIAFPALQLFDMLESCLRELPSLITVLLNAKVSVDRLDEFMKEPNKDETELTPNTKIEMKHASFTWPGSTEPVLCDINLSFQPGLNVICGEVGAGKSALLQALLGEMDQLDGEYHRTNEMVGYCGQTPWLQSMSIRENILFSAPYEEARYKQVLEVCALVPDMANFKHGDLSMIGENGVGLSGGQKARVALARAVYSRANILLLDDPLSALDHQTAEYIVRKCLAGPIMKDRTIILVTHRTELCLGIAQQDIQIVNGRAIILDPETAPLEELYRVPSSEDAKHQDEQLISDSVPDKFIEDEYRAHGGVQAKVYWEYIKAGKLKWWFILIIVLALYRIIDVAETWFLKSWGEAYNDPPQSDELVPDASLAGFFGTFPSPVENIHPWLIGFLILATAQAIAFLVSKAFMLVIIYQAGKALFEKVMVKVTHATFRFYDITPAGRLMNRLTSDINTVDGNISNRFQNVAMLSIAWLSSILVIGSVTPLFLIFAIALTLSFVFIFLHFLPTSQSLRRLEMVSLTPLISNFGQLTEGLTTIRAFNSISRFQDGVINVVDTFQKMDHFYWSLQAWLMFRFDTLSAVAKFLLTVIAMMTSLSAGLTAFVLTAAGKFVIATHGICREYGQLQMDFVSVERIVELLHLDTEKGGDIDPPAWWPRFDSDIIFENVTMRYAPHLDPALKDISLTIKGGITTALIGRTGSGKSTLALSLLGTIMPEKGRILVDGIDISEVNLQTLRQRITFLAQDPVLFPGTMLQNLDPLKEFTVEECGEVLRKVMGVGNGGAGAGVSWSLDTVIDTGGNNLSQGERQMVGLTRAVLRRSGVVILDEATASVDRETAGRVLEVLREELRTATVLVVAHRVEAVRGAEGIVVLSRGRVVESGEVKNNGLSGASTPGMGTGSASASGVVTPLE